MDFKSLATLAGINKDMLNQFATIQSMLSKLPKEKQVEVFTVFTDALTSAVKEVEGVKNEKTDTDTSKQNSSERKDS